MYYCYYYYYYYYYLSKLYAKFQRLFLTFTICMIHDERLAMDFLSRQKIQQIRKMRISPNYRGAQNTEI